MRVSERMADRRRPAIFFGRKTIGEEALMETCIPRVGCPRRWPVTMVLDWSAWWSMTPTMLPIGIALSSCDCCWKSTGTRSDRAFP